MHILRWAPSERQYCVGLYCNYSIIHAYIYIYTHTVRVSIVSSYVCVSLTKTVPVRSQVCVCVCVCAARRTAVAQQLSSHEARRVKESAQDTIDKTKIESHVHLVVLARRSSAHVTFQSSWSVYFCQVPTAAAHLHRAPAPTLAARV